MSKQDVAQGVMRALYKRMVYVAAMLSFIFIAAFLIGIASEQQRINTQQQSDRLKTVEQITRSLKQETQDQTDKINRQLQALCFIIIKTAGPESLNELNPPLDEQCRSLAKDTESARPDQSAPQRPQNTARPNIAMPPPIIQPEPRSAPAPVERKNVKTPPAEQRSPLPPTGLIPSLLIPLRNLTSDREGE